MSNQIEQRRALALPVTIILAVTSLMLSACSSMQTLDLAEDELQARIRAGELVEPGERVELVTSDGREHELRVTSIDDQTIHGEGTAVEIEEVVVLKTRRFHAGKTAALAGGAVGAWVLIAVLIAPAAILAAAVP